MKCILSECDPDVLTIPRQSFLFLYISQKDVPIKIKENKNTLPGTLSLSVHDFNTLVSFLQQIASLFPQNFGGIRRVFVAPDCQTPLGEKQRRQDELLHLQRLKGDPDCSQRPSDHFRLSKISTRMTKWMDLDQ